MNVRFTVNPLTFIMLSTDEHRFISIVLKWTNFVNNFGYVCENFETIGLSFFRFFLHKFSMEKIKSTLFSPWKTCVQNNIIVLVTLAETHL